MSLAKRSVLGRGVTKYTKGSAYSERGFSLTKPCHNYHIYSKAG
jgi:hypothetical protein